MEQEFLELLETIAPHERDSAIYIHPDFEVPVTWNDLKKAIEDKTPLAMITLKALARAGIIAN